MTPISGATPTTPFVLRPMTRQQRYLKAIIYGLPGVGKTVLVGSAADVPWMNDVILLDAEGGTLSISDKESIITIPVTRFKQVARVKEFLGLHCRYRDAGDDERLLELQRKYMGEEVVTESNQEPYRFRTLIVDSLTEVQKLLMYQILGAEPGTLKLDEEPDTAEWKQWGQNAEMMRNLIRELRNMPMHMLLVMGQLEDQDERKRVFRKPSLPGRLATEIQGFVDVVGWMTTTQVKPDPQGPDVLVRRLHLQPRAAFHAKNRIPGFEAPYLDNPTVADLVRPLSNGMTN